MPKKSTPVRSGAQRSKPKASKGFELVRPTTTQSELTEVEQPVELESETSVEQSERAFSDTKSSAIATKERIEDAPIVPQRRSRGHSTQDAAELTALPAVPQKKSNEDNEDVASTTSSPKTSTIPATSTKGSASERLAARRQGTQKAQQRNAATLITAEHYSYVRRDLMFIAVLAIIMFIVLAVLYFVPGI